MEQKIVRMREYIVIELINMSNVIKQTNGAYFSKALNLISTIDC